MGRSKNGFPSLMRFSRSQPSNLVLKRCQSARDISFPHTTAHFEPSGRIERLSAPHNLLLSTRYFVDISFLHSFPLLAQILCSKALYGRTRLGNTVLSTLTPCTPPYCAVAVAI
jgi:hypothetical protein